MLFTEETLQAQIDEKYINYVDNIIKKKNFVNGHRVNRKKYPIIDNKDGTFFHMISTDYKGKVPCKPCYSLHNCTSLYKYNPLLLLKPSRILCPHRIDNFDITDFFNRKLKIWPKRVTTPKGIRDRILCLDDLNNYLIVLDYKNGNLKIWTGYPIEYEKQRIKFLKEYNEYIEKTPERKQIKSYAE